MHLLSEGVILFIFHSFLYEWAPLYTNGYISLFPSGVMNIFREYFARTCSALCKIYGKKIWNDVESKLSFVCWLRNIATFFIKVEKWFIQKQVGNKRVILKAC